MTGAVLALMGAAIFAISSIIIRRGVVRVSDPTVGVLVSVPTSVPFFLVVLLAIGKFGDLFAFSWQSYAWLCAAGVIHFGGGRVFNYAGVKILGANVSSVLHRVSPLLTASMGVGLFGEALTWQLVVGVSCIVAGVIGVVWNPKAFERATKLPRADFRKGVFFAIGAGFFFGISPALTKMGLQPGVSPVAATAITYLAASAAIAMYLFSPKKREGLRQMGGRSFLLFYTTGLAASMSHLLRYIALSIAPLSIVSPLFDTSPVFLLGLSFIINRRIEVFNKATVAGMLVVVVGAVLLSTA